MNYYNPYFSMAPYGAATSAAGKGILGGLAGKGFSFSSLISGTQKTLGLINQAIPVIKQVTPVWKNAKTMFRVMNEFKKVDTPTTTTQQTNSTSNEKYEFINSQSTLDTSSPSSSGNEFAPTFFQ